MMPCPWISPWVEAIGVIGASEAEQRDALARLRDAREGAHWIEPKAPEPVERSRTLHLDSVVEPPTEYQTDADVFFPARQHTTQQRATGGLRSEW